MEETVAYLFSIANLLIGLLIGILIMLRANPYAWSNFKSRLLNRSYGVMEVELNNNEIGVKSINMDELELAYGSKTESPKFKSDRMMFRRKLNCPTIHFNYLSTDPVTLIHEMKLIKQIPALVELKLGISRMVKDGKGEKQVNEEKIIRVPFKDLKVLPNFTEYQGENGQKYEVDQTWIGASEQIIIKPPETSPEKLSALVNKIRARAEVEASLQRLQQLIDMVKNTRWNFYIGVVSLVLILALAYMVYQQSGEIGALKQVSYDTFYRVNQTAITPLINMNLTGG